MKLVVKSIRKVTKKVDDLPQTIYQCVLEGADPSGTSTVFGKVTLEAEDPETLNDIVRQAIDAEVEIKFLQPQVTLERFAEQG